jgi:uncharacterized protein (TIGR02996 family)
MTQQGKNEAEKAFLDVIRERPDDDTPRLAYADWLNERGDPRGEFIRLQCELAKAPQNPRRAEMAAREGELLRAHQREWEKPLRDLGARGIIFDRGFPVRVDMESAAFLRNADELFVGTPIRELCLDLSAPGDIAAIAASPHLHNLTALTFFGHGTGIGDAGARALAESPHLRNLTTLSLDFTGIGDEGARALATSPHLNTLTTLSLWANAIGNEGARALAASPNLNNLTMLHLGDNHIGDEGARALAASAHQNLTGLDLSGNAVGRAASYEIQRTLHTRRQAAGEERGV